MYKLLVYLGYWKQLPNHCFWLSWLFQDVLVLPSSALVGKIIWIWAEVDLLVPVACVRCHGTKCPLLTALLSKPKLNHQFNSTEFEVRLHSYLVIHPPPPHNRNSLRRLGLWLADDFIGKPPHWLLGVNSYWSELSTSLMSYGYCRQT